MFRSAVSRVLGVAVLAITVGALTASPVRATGASPSGGQVFQATNDPAGNAIQVFDQAADGRLAVGELVATGGLGSGDSLGSQGAVVRDGRHVLVVNAGDSTVSSLIVRGGDLELRDIVASGGVRPVSVTVHGNTVYVLNAGSDTISGLRLERDGHLRPISNSTLPLSASGVGAAQIQFSSDGDELIVTEKTTAKIDLYRVGRDGRATGPVVFDSVGAVPFGFDVDRHDNVIVSEAAGGALVVVPAASPRTRGGDALAGGHPGGRLLGRDLTRWTLRVHDQRCERHDLVVHDRPWRRTQLARAGGRDHWCWPHRSGEQ